jgi:hypothetical protein
MSSPSERDTGLLDFLVGEEPDERFIAEIADLNTVSPGIAEVATKAGHQGKFVLVDELLPHFLDLFAVANYETEMLRAIRLQCLHFKDRHELMLTQLAPSGAFAAAEHLQAKDIGIEFHRFLGVGDLYDDMVTSVDLDCHLPLPFSS